MQRQSEPGTAAAACSDAERRRALALAGELEIAGRPGRVVTLWVRPASWAAQTLCAVAGVGASVVGVDNPEIGLAVAATALVLCSAEFTRRPILRLLTPARATQNVISPPPPRAGRRPVTLILTATLDDPRRHIAGWLPVRLPAVVLGSLALVAAALLVRVLATPGGWLDVVQLLPTLTLLATIPLLLDEGLGAIEPGASVAAPLLDLAGRLDAAAPQNLDVAVVLAGAGDRQAAGLHSWLRGRRRLGLRPVDLAIVHLEPREDDAAVWWERDGTVVATRLHPQLVQAAHRAAERHGGGQAVRSRRATAAGIAHGDGWPAIAVGPDTEFAFALVSELDAALSGTPAPASGN